MAEAVRPFARPALAVGLAVLAAGTVLAGVSSSDRTSTPSQTSAQLVTTPESTTTQPTTTTISPADVAIAALADQIAEDRSAALEIVGDQGGCLEASIEVCVANVLMWVAPDSPAIQPALDRAAVIETEKLARFYATVAVAETAEEKRKLGEFYAAAAAAEAAEEERRLADFYAAAQRRERVLAEQAEADAIRIGEDLVRRTCGDAGGYYQYWTNPPRAEVTSCNRVSNQATGSNRTGAVCNDGTSSNATGRGACSWHDGVAYWTYD